MSTEPGVLRRISWRDLCPWFVLFRTVGVAIRMPLLCLGAAAILLTPLGWWTGRLLFLSEAELKDARLSEIARDQESWPGHSFAGPRLPQTVESAARKSFDYGRVAAALTARPVFFLMQTPPTITKYAYFGWGLLWTFAVWGVFAGAVTRIAVVQLGCEERVTLTEGLRFALRRWLSYFSAPLLPLLGVVIIALLTVACGWVMSLGDWGMLVGGLLWLSSLLGSSIISILLLGLMFGWPLMPVAIGAEEGGDTFEALSRSYAYTFQRPLRYLFYAALACLVGGLGWLLVDGFTTFAIALSYQNAALGGGDAMIGEVQETGLDEPAFDTLRNAGMSLIALSVAVVRVLAAGFHFSYFWCVGAAIYLLLRQDIDEAEFDEVYLEGEEERYALPPLEPAPSGVPRVADPADREGEKEQAGEKSQDKDASAQKSDDSEDTGPE